MRNYVNPFSRGTFRNSKPPAEHVVDMSRLDGGLNLWDLEYRMASNQSPNMLNMYWIDGALSSRRGQDYISNPVGRIVAAYKKPFNGQVIFHAGNKLYRMPLSAEAKMADTLLEPVVIKEGLASTKGGSFFEFGAFLYYKTEGVYIKIGDDFKAEDVVGYVPILVINAKPDGTGASLYQAENRLSKFKIARFTSDGKSVDYFLPIKDLDADFTPEVKVDGAENKNFTFDAKLGKVHFNEAPKQTDPVSQNNVEIKFAKTDLTAMQSVMSCRVACAYGAENDVCVVMGGGSVQPNAYLWSGTNFVADPTYFPTDYYNLAGQSDEAITGFSRQQNMLIIFKPRSIGKTVFSTQVIDGLVNISLPYTNINTSLGCDLPNTIQLIQNNTVFANSYGGVYFLADTSQANENNVVRISKNINGDLTKGKSRGLLADIADASTGEGKSKDYVTSVDDDNRYWIVANGVAYLWDYALSGNIGAETTLSWFRFNNIKAGAWVKVEDDIIYGDIEGRFIKFISRYSDFNPNYDPMAEAGTPNSFKFQAFEKRYDFAVQDFGIHDRLKDVFKVVFVTRTDVYTKMDITYRTDYEIRKDKTPIVSATYTLAPRNLTYRMLAVARFASMNVRKPRAIHVRHFGMSLTNNIIDSGMSLVSAQIYFRLSGEER